MCRYWLCAASGPSIKVWDLESKNQVEDLRPEIPGSARAEPPQVTSLAWSADGQTLFAGYTDNLIRVWQVTMKNISSSSSKIFHHQVLRILIIKFFIIIKF